MHSAIANNFRLQLKNQINCKIPSRNIAPICGPPSYPMSTAKKLIMGGGSILLMVAIPIWGLLSLPSWAIKNQNLGKARKDTEDLEGPPAA